jgi:chemotaxis protein MotD
VSDQPSDTTPTDSAQAAPLDLTVPQQKPAKAGQSDKAGKTGDQAAIGKTAKANSDTLSADDAAAGGTPVDANPAAPTSSDADKQQIARARGEVSADGHEATKVDAPAAAPAATTASGKAADAAAPQFLTATSHTAAAAPTTPVANAAHTAPQAAAVSLADVAIEIASKAVAGEHSFDIRLDPPELGRIDVRLNVDRNGHVTSHLIADRSDTLDLLRRDSAGLERALQDAGLKTSDNGMQFSLRDHSTGQEQRRNGAETAQLVVNDETPLADAMPQGYGRLAGRTGGLDIRV